MNALVEQLRRGENYFGSGGYNTPQFEGFFIKFKSSLTRQLKHLEATDISFSKLHFGLSGFFKIKEQWYYFTLSDVRQGDFDYDDNPVMLFRTSTHNKDYTGGVNQYIAFKTQMYREIASVFRITYKIPKKNSTIDLDKLVTKTLTRKFLRRKLPSMKLANRFCWKLMDKLGLSSKAISFTRRGRFIIKSEFKCELFEFRYDGESHTTEVILTSLTNEELLKTLDIPKEPQVRTNPYSGAHCTLEPTAVAVHDYIKKCERNNYVEGLRQGIEIFATRWAAEYMILID